MSVRERRFFRITKSVVAISPEEPSWCGARLRHCARLCEALARPLESLPAVNTFAVLRPAPGRVSGAAAAAGEAESGGEKPPVPLWELC